ncbi:acylphosphatase [Aquimarina sp. AU474]|uniref:acylphosphatase n=1 Tax=Aquimarina sp. AU474 TaxID=2108529 RepID=UPI000D691AC9|nr:acylphosphatase [Aquimarina sp. AU474]
MKHYNIIVTGTVQGVWYRKSTLEKALELNIKGFVKNQANGDVYIEAEGNDIQLQHLLDWCKVGPKFAKVSHVNAKEGDVLSFDDFKILH